MSGSSLSFLQHRAVRPELLDHLPPADPQARRSRRDLRRINFLMGNERWIRRTLRRFPEAASQGIVELGAGDGTLVSQVARLFPDAAVTAYDLAPRAPDLEAQIRWRQGDLLQALEEMRGGVLIANLFLHHFEASELAAIGGVCDRFQVLLFNEPDRTLLPHVQGCLLRPFVNSITRHDLHTSIDAGFKAGELPAWMKLRTSEWHLREHSTWSGARRMLGWRR